MDRTLRGGLAGLFMGTGMLLAALGGLALPGDAAAEGRIVVQPHQGDRGRTPKNDVEYKVRDADGNLVARGWISPDEGQSTATVDLPPGDYTVETYSDLDDGSRIGGRSQVKLEDGERQGQQVIMDPLSPEEDLQEQVEDLEDRIEELEGQIEELEGDIAEHERRGEDDAVEQHQDELKRLRENLERKERQLRRKRAELARLRRGPNVQPKGVEAPHVKVPTRVQPHETPNVPRY